MHESDEPKVLVDLPHPTSMLINMGCGDPVPGPAGREAEGNSEDCVAAHVRTFERYLAGHERLDFGSAGDGATHARRKARFKVAFQSSAKLSKTRGGESPRFFPGAACDEKRRKCAPLASRVRRSISCRPSCRCIVCLLVSGNREIDDFMTVPRSRPG